MENKDALMPDCGVHYLWFAFVCFLIRSHPPLYKLRPCPSYSRHRDRINLGPDFNSVPNVVQPHKAWVW